MERFRVDRLFLASLFVPLLGLCNLSNLQQPEHEIHKLIQTRWSPRAMNGEKMAENELMCLFEAARLAPSNFNEQPWRILYAHRDTPQWKLFFDTLVDFNQQWCKNAAALVVFISKETFARNGKMNPCHSFDTGAAWMSLALEGHSRSLVVHGIRGFDEEKIRNNLEIPDGYTIEAMAAIGNKAPIESLTANLQTMEKPSPRRALDQIAFEGKFQNLISK